MASAGVPHAVSAQKGQTKGATPWASAPAYLVRDNDRAYGHVFTERVRAMGIRDPRSLLDRHAKMALSNV